MAATSASVWVGSLPLTRQQSMTLIVGSLAALLVFFLVARNPRPSSLPFSKMFVQQLRLIAFPLILAGSVEAGVFWWLGWSDAALLRASCLWAFAGATGLLLTRSLSFFTIAHPAVQRRLTQKIAIIGYDEHAFRIADRLSADTRKSTSVLGIFDDRPRSSTQYAAPNAPALHGSIADLIALSQKSKLDCIIIALPPGPGQETQIAGLSWMLRSVLADVLVVPYLISGPNFALPVQSIGPMSFMVLQRRPLNDWQAIAKRAFDFSFAAIVFLALFPLFLLVAMAIKLDSSGPILFRQPRRGLNNQHFTVFKFRSMHTKTSDFMCLRQTSRGDPRVTRVGKWLRRLSIDELPQVLNVLRGEMSLVGPRPHALETRVEGELLNDVIEEYALRYHVKPGITGWAQINGARGEMVTADDLRKRVAYDLEYIQHWSIGFDFKIVALTALREIMSKHAF